jgi:hypothetical protein
LFVVCRAKSAISEAAGKANSQFTDYLKNGGANEPKEIQSNQMRKILTSELDKITPQSKTSDSNNSAPPANNIKPTGNDD